MKTTQRITRTAMNLGVAFSAAAGVGLLLLSILLHVFNRPKEMEF